MAATRPPAGRRPDWFHKMDRNHDGDVSRREFLGPRDQFDRLDRDKDGLIDADEARRQGGEEQGRPAGWQGSLAAFRRIECTAPPTRPSQGGKGLATDPILPPAKAGFGGGESSTRTFAYAT